MEKEPEHKSTQADGNQDSRLKLIDYFIKRQEHTLSHSQTATRLIYLVNGAILTAVYFGFDKIQNDSWAYRFAAMSCFVLSIINYLHANLWYVQNAWYSNLDERIRNVFMDFYRVKEVWPQHLGVTQDNVLERFKSKGRYKVFRFPFSRSHMIYVTIHFVISIALFVFSVVFFLMSFSGVGSNQ